MIHAFISFQSVLTVLYLCDVYMVASNTTLQAAKDRKQRLITATRPLNKRSICVKFLIQTLAATSTLYLAILINAVETLHCNIPNMAAAEDNFTWTQVCQTQTQFTITAEVWTTINT